MAECSRTGKKEGKGRRENTKTRLRGRAGARAREEKCLRSQRNVLSRSPSELFPALLSLCSFASPDSDVAGATPGRSFAAAVATFKTRFRGRCASRRKGMFVENFKAHNYGTSEGRSRVRMFKYFFVKHRQCRDDGERAVSKRNTVYTVARGDPEL